jgi:hypothetical protein
MLPGRVTGGPPCLISEGAGPEDPAGVLARADEVIQ